MYRYKVSNFLRTFITSLIKLINSVRSISRNKNCGTKHRLKALNVLSIALWDKLFFREQQFIIMSRFR